MAFLITGCAGFIGSHLCAALQDRGEKVIGIDAFTHNYPIEFKKKNLSALQKSSSFQFIEGNLVEMDLSSILKEVTCIFHTAGQPGVRSSWGDQFDLYLQNNIHATQRILETIKTLGRSIRVVFSSSSSIYGNTHQLPVTETALPQPYSPYGTTKLAAEHLCHLYYMNYGVPVVSLRYFTVYGPRQRPDMGFHIFIKALLQGDTISVLGDGSQTRDFTFVEDIVQANLAAAEKEVTGKIFNIGGGSRTSLMNVFDILHEVTGITPQLTFCPVQKGDVKDTWADTGQARTLLGFQPSTGLQEGLAKQFEWEKSIYGS